MLIYARLLIAVFLLATSFLHWPFYSLMAVILFSVGLLTDVFDGIIARRLGVSSQKMRRLDSGVDQVFWCFSAIAAFVHCPSFFYENYIKLAVLIGTEIAAYCVSYIKFRKEVATHAIASKIWVLLIFATLAQVMAVCSAPVLFEWCFYVGIITRLEIICILLVLKTWASDVPTVYHAIKLRQGKTIKRHKLFNG